MTRESALEASAVSMPAMPLTIEGSSVLHQMMRIRRTAWNALPPEQQHEIVQQATAALSALEGSGPTQTALYSIIGHKADLMLLHFRRDFEQLDRAQRNIARLFLSDFLEPATSYLSMVELGLYESSIKVYQSLSERGIAPYTPDWNREIEEVLARQREAMSSRLWPAIPDHKYICFYPMDRKRGESINWYRESMSERQRRMHEHGMIGRRYAGEVKQIITGSIGFDDWEWGVDLFADNPLTFKRLIYEMRFDEVSAVYASFGTFYIGLRVPASGLSALMGL
jgi:chlorite dismutase